MPGLGVKRWFGVLLAGITVGGLGLAILVIDLYRNFPESELDSYNSISIPAIPAEICAGAYLRIPGNWIDYNRTYGG